MRLGNKSGGVRRQEYQTHEFVFNVKLLRCENLLWIVFNCVNPRLNSTETKSYFYNMSHSDAASKEMCAVCGYNC